MRVLKIVKTNIPSPFRSKPQWKTIGEKKCYFRSQWEVTFASYLEFLKRNKQIAEWFFEPQTFWFEKIRRGTRSYKPDFKVVRLDTTHYWVEVKGYMDPKSHTKIKRFKKYYPQEELQIIEGQWFLNKKQELLEKLSKVPHVD